MKSNSPIVSIILPVYNSQAYIAQCMDQLVNQTLQEIEVICVNDGSTDKSLEILRSYAQKDARVKVYDQANAGPAAARNHALRYVLGQYIMFCDSDDWYEPRMCERMVATLETTSVDLVICDSQTVRDEDRYHRADEGYHNLSLFGYYELGENAKRRVNALLWNKIFKAQLIADFGISFPPSYYDDDASFVFQYVCAAKSIFGLEETLYNRRLRTDSIMHHALSGDDKDFDCLHVFKHNFNYLIKNHLWSQNTQYFICSLYDVLINNVGRYKSEDDQLKFLNLLHEIVKYIDLDVVKKNGNMLGLNELCEIKEKIYTRFIPKRKKKFIFTKEKFKDITHIYAFNTKILTKKQTKYQKELKLFGIRVYKKINYHEYMIDDLRAITQYFCHGDHK